MLPSSERHTARRPVHQGAEALHRQPADGVDEPFDEPPVQMAHELGVLLGQLGERAPRERHFSAVLGDGRVEAHPGQLVDQRGKAHGGPVVGVTTTVPGSAP